MPVEGSKFGGCPPGGRDARAAAGVVALVVLGALGVPALPVLATPWGGTLAAQETTRASRAVGTYRVGLSLGAFEGYPSDFSRPSCESGVMGVSAVVARRVGPLVSVEAAAGAVSEAGGMVCAEPLRPAPLDGEAYTRTTMDESIPGAGLVTTSLSLAVEPLADRAVSPRVRVGAGRAWNKKLWMWSYGADVRWAFGRHGLVWGVERWNFGYDVRVDELIYREAAPHELQSSNVVRRTPRPWTFRVGWELAIG